MRLPFGENAVVEPVKLLAYCLNPAHEEGKHKARVFRAALGLTAKDAEFLRARLLLAARDGEVHQQRQTAFGVLYDVDFTMEYNGHSARIRSGWILESGSCTPRLTTCFIVKRGGLHVHG